VQRIDRHPCTLEKITEKKLSSHHDRQNTRVTVLEKAKEKICRNCSPTTPTVLLTVGNFVCHTEQGIIGPGSLSIVDGS
jgi:hypothetical protein